MKRTILDMDSKTFEITVFVVLFLILGTLFIFEVLPKAMDNDETSGWCLINATILDPNNVTLCGAIGWHQECKNFVKEQNPNATFCMHGFSDSCRNKTINTYEIKIECNPIETPLLESSGGFA